MFPLSPLAGCSGLPPKIRKISSKRSRAAEPVTPQNVGAQRGSTNDVPVPVANQVRDKKGISLPLPNSVSVNVDQTALVRHGEAIETPVLRLHLRFAPGGANQKMSFVLSQKNSTKMIQSRTSHQPR